ncbi:hypothetical protein GCM10010869_75800 [Mesorhizobium tianshanense]|uniref:Uncharacterized protein n=1 Tax=Mesorhizobium tianshanense TaxID=39844 RepID=A0A562MQ41_9HYPH|nr:hypothetical protein [Mesorhizobium tianshanense]TWI22044.1 hypothetical protein IQ26_06725 [Mesorhizobium tianshanense]GLS41983.1 hypothetical protein GCM10010869_75800 [Mesorhizobium tianshanense]
MRYLAWKYTPECYRSSGGGPISRKFEKQRVEVEAAMPGRGIWRKSRRSYCSVELGCEIAWGDRVDDDNVTAPFSGSGACLNPRRILAATHKWQRHCHYVIAH